MSTRAKQNCWEYQSCGHGPGSDDLCPAAVDETSNGVNSGVNAGRVCWTVDLTRCFGIRQGLYAEKIGECVACAFFEKVREDEKEKFQLLKLGRGLEHIGDLRARISHVESLTDIHRRIHSKFELKRLLHDVAVEARQATQSQRCIVFLLLGEPPQLRAEFRLGGRPIDVVIPVDENSGVGYTALYNRIVNLKDIPSSPMRDVAPRFNLEFDNRCETKTESLLAVPIRDPQDNVLGVIAAVNSERGYFCADDQWFLSQYAVEVALAIEKGRLLEESTTAERLVSIGKTVAGLSHCIKGIAHVLRASSFVMRRAIASNRLPDVQTVWEILDRHVEKLADLALDILGLEPGRDKAMVVANLNDTIKNVVRLLREEAAARAVEVVAKLGAGMERCSFAPGQMYRLLVNLILNAFQACGCKGGKVVISTQNVNDNEVMIAVQDNGCGMEDELKAEIFKIFKSTKKEPGSGIGLSTVLDIVKQHRGRIEVDSAVGRGTTFRVFIPICRVSPASG